MPDRSDPLAAFLAGLQGSSGETGRDAPPVGASGPPATLLSNGLNADAGVAQLVSALASLHAGNAAFHATPFAGEGDPGPHGVIAPAASST